MIVMITVLFVLQLRSWTYKRNKRYIYEKMSVDLFANLTLHYDVELSHFTYPTVLHIK